MLQLARLNKVKRPRRLPVQNPPTALEREYAALLQRGILEDVFAIIRRELLPRLEFFAANASRLAQDAGEDDLGDIFDGMFETYSKQWTRRRVGDVARQEARRTAAFQATQLNRQLRPTLGIDVVGYEPWLDRAIDEFTRENVALIRSIPENLFADLEKLLAKEIADGARFESMVTVIEERFEVSKSRAELIARDQVQKFHGDLNRVRQQDLGIEKFIWNTVGDGRVREEHAERDGKIYSWNDLPNGESPGEPVGCRCVGEPVLPEFE